MPVAVVNFPGSAADDAAHALQRALHVEPRLVWHDQETLGDCDFLVIPGGYSFCDYLRPGALTRTSAIAPAIRRFSREGRVLGIGNGFQILCELGVLPGALLPNAEGGFISDDVFIRLENTKCSLTKSIEAGAKFRIPLACGCGRYYLDQRTLTEYEDKGCIVFRYCDEEGDVSAETAVTGSVRAIAAMTNLTGNVLGIMPHPEYAVEELLGNTDGAKLFQAAMGEGER